MKIKQSRIREIIKEEYQRLAENENKELNGLTARTAWNKAETHKNNLEMI